VKPLLPQMEMTNWSIWFSRSEWSGVCFTLVLRFKAIKVSRFSHLVIRRRVETSHMDAWETCPVILPITPTGFNYIPAGWISWNQILSNIYIYFFFPILITLHFRVQFSLLTWLKNMIYIWNKIEMRLYFF